MGKVYKIAPEIKKEILDKVKAGKEPVSQVAKAYGISDATIYHWLNAGTKGSPTWSEYSKLKKERDDLLKIVGELTARLSVTQKKIW